MCPLNMIKSPLVVSKEVIKNTKFQELNTD